METTGAPQPRVAGLSGRGSLAASSQIRPDLELYFEALANCYDPTDNPDGYILMNVAENKLGWTVLKGKLEAISCDHSIQDWTAGYTEPQGNPDVRAAVAGFLSEHLTKCALDPTCLVLTAGASAAFDLAAFLLADPGGVAVFPAPNYPAYTHDVQAKAELERYDLITHHEPDEIRNGPLLSTEHLDQALRHIDADGKHFKMLVLTTPDNPTGGVYSRATLDEIADWCIDHTVHLIVNEIYGLSVIDTQHPELAADYEDPSPSVSFGRILEERRSDYLHYVYAFSKDFGISGFRLGVVYSRNAAFVQGLATLNTAHMTSNHSQWLLQSLLDDRHFIAEYVTDNGRLLTEAYVDVVQSLRHHQISYVPSRGGLFVWIDLSEFLAAPSPEAEDALWLEIFHESGVLLTPGKGFGHTKRGLFRLVFVGVSRKARLLAMERLGQFIATKRSNGNGG